MLDQIVFYFLPHWRISALLVVTRRNVVQSDFF